jgi:general stress protein YciG
MSVEEKKELISKEAQRRLIEGARKGGKAEKHFTSESKERQIEGARKGGKASSGAEKHYTPESKERQIAGARKGGHHSHAGGFGQVKKFNTRSK